MTSISHLAVALADVPEHEAQGYSVVMDLPQPERGTDVLMRRVVVGVVDGHYLPCAPADRARIEAWAKNLDVTVEVAVSILASRLAPVEVYERAVRR